MDTEPIPARTRALLREIRNQDPDLILLQEVTPQTFPMLKKALCAPSSDPSAAVPKEPAAPRADRSSPTDKAAAPSKDGAPGQEGRARYRLHIGAGWPDELPYFAVLFSRMGLGVEEPVTKAEMFVGSRMHRGYICAELGIGNGVRVAVITAHLESLKESGLIRKVQFGRIVDMMREYGSKGVVSVFAGDTNLREPEISAKEVYKTAAAEEKRRVGKEAKVEERARKRRRVGEERLVDAWLAAGGPVGDKFTWDMQKNDNLDGFGDGFRPRSRYDRVFLLGEVEVGRFGLVGRERLGCGKFISDHWGVCVDLVFGGSG